MSRDRFTRAKELFLALLELTPEDRPVALEEACAGDDDLRGAVQALLDHHEPATGEATSIHTAVEHAGSRSRSGGLDTGHVVANRYRVVDRLGRGGMGVVYRAHDLVLDLPVALKFLHGVSRTRQEGLLDEVRLARQVSHPSVCRVFDVGHEGDEVFLSMEYVDGEDLASLIKRIGRLPTDKLVDVARQMAAGVAAAHARGVIHRDLKPANVMIDREGRVKITDFGIATETAGPGRGRLMGTPAYMAPEQLAGQGASVRSDLYALGLVIHEAATGRRVFDAGSIADHLERRRSSPPPPLATVTPLLDHRLATVVDRCLLADPDERPTSALAVAGALPGGDAISLALEVGATPSPELIAGAGGVGPPAPAWLRGGWLLAALVALLGLALVSADLASTAARPDQIMPPAALAERAGQLLRDLGYPPPTDRAWGFDPYLEVRTGAGAHLFWYRESPSPLIPDSAFNIALATGRVDLFDPPPSEEGMVQVVLDSTGRLVELEAVPLLNEGAEETTPEADWSIVLAAAGLDPAALRPAASAVPPNHFADQRKAWLSDGEPAIHIDAAARHGQVTFFDADPLKAQRDQAEEAIVDRASSIWLVFDLLLVLFVAAAAILGRASFRRGDGDRVGARGLVLAVVVLRLGAWVLTADHVPSVEGELTSFQLALGTTLIEVLFVWLAYIALEPLVRRAWPRTLVAWSRLLRGRLGDEAVGRSLLLGVIAGVLWATLANLDLVLTDTLGLTLGPMVDRAFPLAPALNGRLPTANLLGIAADALEGGITALFALTLLHRGFRRRGWAVAAFAIALAALRCLAGANPLVSIPLLGVVVAGSGTLLLVRAGLLAYVAARWTEDLLVSSPLTLELDAWFAPTGLYAVVAVSLVAILGWWLSATRMGR